MVQLVGCVRNLLPMTRTECTYVDHLTDAAISVDHQTVGMGAHLVSIHAILQRGIVASHVNRQVVAILVSFLRLDICHWELQISSHVQTDGECLQRERHGGVICHTSQVNTGTRRGSELAILHIQVALRAEECVHLH